MAGVASTWTIVYETSTGTTESATQTLVPLHWERATWTLRRRAPHAFTISVPVHSHHLPGDFLARREIRLKRDGVYVAWGAGFMGAPQLTRAGEDWGGIDLPGYGNIICLDFAFIGFNAFGWDTDGLIGSNLLDEAEHGVTGGDWFPSAQRTLGTGTVTLAQYNTQGKRAIDVLNEFVDLEGWAWRAGINSSGVFTFTANATIDTDRSSTIHAIDRANCRITALTNDDSRLASNVQIFSHYPAYRSRLNGGEAVGATVITVDSTVGLESGDTVWITPGLASTDIQTVNVVTSATEFSITGGGLTYAHADNSEVLLPTEYFRSSAPLENATTAAAHHTLITRLFDDTLADTELRDLVAAATQAVYDSVLRTATVETTDPALIAAMLDAGLQPGDSIKLTSSHRYLSAWYAGTTVRVQEMAIDLEPGGCRRITLSVGDPRLDDLAVMERMVRAGNRAAAAYRRTS